MFLTQNKGMKKECSEVNELGQDREETDPEVRQGSIYGSQIL
jgi:hypothetical protein